MYHPVFITEARSIRESLQLLQWNTNIFKNGSRYGSRLLSTAGNEDAISGIDAKYQELAKTIAGTIKANQAEAVKILITYVFFTDTKMTTLRPYSTIKDIVSELLELSDTQVFVVTNHTVTEWYPKLVGEYGWDRVLAWFYSELLKTNDEAALAKLFPDNYNIEIANKVLNIKVAIEISSKVYKDLAKKANVTPQDLIELFEGFKKEHEKEANV